MLVAMVKPHRVPESVFEVEFKLFDIMSMKQFVIVMVTAGFAVLFYFLLDKITASFFKWLVVITIVIVGLIVAFLKLQGEPFEVYVTNFILALVSPQRRVWSKANQLPEYLKDSTQPSPKQVSELAQKAQKAATPAISQEMLQTITQTKQAPGPLTELDLIEKQYLEGKLPVFGAVKRSEPQAQVEPAPSAEAPKPAGRQPPITTPVQLVPPPQPPTTLETPEPQTQTPLVTQPVQSNAPSPLQSQMNISEEAVSTESLNNSAATIPKAAMKPNVFAGEVYSYDGKPLTTVLINIRQKQANGPIIRALTSNPLGQFVSSDPLQDGKYVVELIKPGYKFPRYKFHAKGELILPKRYLGQPG